MEDCQKERKECFLGRSELVETVGIQLNKCFVKVDLCLKFDYNRCCPPSLFGAELYGLLNLKYKGFKKLWLDERRDWL